MTSFASQVSVNQSAEFFGRFGRFGGDMELLKALLADDERMRAWVEALRIPAAPVGRIVHVNLSLSYPEMIRLGQYTNEAQTIWEITEARFPIIRTGELQYDKELFLVPPSRDGLTTTEWKAELEANGWVLEQAPEFLALGVQYPELQRDCYIVAFGSAWSNPDGHVFSPALWSVDSHRRAGTDWYGPGNLWNLHHRALVSRK